MTRLPEAIIHLIQSFLSEEEVARTTLISKSWYKAWLTRPVLVLRSSAAEFSKLAVKTMRRYQDSNLKIEGLSLKIEGATSSVEPVARRLIVDAMKMGATDLNIEFILPKSVPTTFVLPAEVLGSETLLRLSVIGCVIDGNVVNCSMLKSLSLDNVVLKRADMLRIMTSYCNSIEELSLSNTHLISNYKLILSGWDMHWLRKLKRLYLEMVTVGSLFFDNLESRFPCLEDMSLVRCCCHPRLVKSSSLKRISIVQCPELRIMFEVPNLAVFSYSGEHVPWSISIKARDGWESHISMEVHHFQTSSWYRDLHKLMTSSWYRELHMLLTQLSSSRINLSININIGSRSGYVSDISMSDILRVVAKPVAVENLRVEAENDVGRIMRCLFRICRPKLVTLCWLDSEVWISDDEHSLKNLCEKLMPSKKRRRNMFKVFDLKEGKVEVYEEDVAEWRPLLLQDALTTPPTGRKVRFHLKW
ncbi:uncharacterized protein LOC130993040 [Salvia miltiorrhiza]|uniref:uncharacterized protein LOC130993040 n=1 Tax=Salvia miltiorrhiza TaxID=226208 RepID=UPI0025AC69A4|nr:uncharacterized protein LOC130993040 [Salvia miltiorrhiza]